MPRDPDDVPDSVFARLLLDGFGSPADERRRMRAAGARMVVHGDPDYPPQLAVIADPPAGLWLRGDIAAVGAVPVAIVGARRASSYGIAQAGRFAGYLAEQGVTIVSGGARGVDAEAHRAALRAGAPTVAVVGCGLGAGPYPPEHAGLYQAIVDGGGALLSEFPTLYPIRTDNFPRRNRIISGISVAVVVIEASVASGALITARLCVGEHNRTAFALPGPVDSPRSEGCNRAIRDGEAHLALAPEDVYAAVAGEGSLFAAGSRLAAARAPLPADILGAQAAVRQFLEAEPNADCARIVEGTALPAHRVQAALTLLALEFPARSSRLRRRASRTEGRSG